MYRTSMTRKPNFYHSSYRSSRDAFGTSFHSSERRWRNRGSRFDFSAHLDTLALKIKGVATKILFYIMFFLSLTMTAYASYQAHTIHQLRTAIEEGNSTQCDDGYLSKIVDGGRVTCVMQRVAPGMVTYKKVMSIRR